MNVFVSGSLATGAVGIIGIAISSRPKTSRKPHALTKDTAILLKIIGNLEKPSLPDPLSPKLYFPDVLSVYLNSRDDRDWANTRRLENPDAGSSLLLSRLDANHTRIKKQVAAWFFLQIVVRLAPDCHTSHCRNLLRSYAEGQELLSQLAEYCSRRDRQYILTRM